MRRIVGIGMLLGLLMSGPASAYVFLVEDVVAIGEAVIQNLNWAVSLGNDEIEIGHQVTQIARLVDQVRMMTTNLESIGDIVPFLRTLDGALAALGAEVGVPYTRAAVIDRVLDIYPLYGATEYPGQAAFQTHDRRLTKQVWDSARGAMVGQGIQDDLTRDVQTLEMQVNTSRAAVGNLAVSQSTNELLGTHIMQTLRLQQLTAQNGRVQASEAMQRAAELETEQQTLGYLTSDWPTSIPRPIINRLP